jgi:hypothetical protein
MTVDENKAAIAALEERVAALESASRYQSSFLEKTEAFLEGTSRKVKFAKDLVEAVLGDDD